MGVFRPVLAIYSLQDSPYSVENVGERPHEQPDQGSQSATHNSSLQTGAYGATRRLPEPQPWPPEQIFLALCRLRDSKLCERHRADIFHGHVFGWRIY